MTNLPLHFFLVDLIGECHELPEIVADNAKCCSRRHYYKEMLPDDGLNDWGEMMMDASCHSTASSVGGSFSSRWDSMPFSSNGKAVDRLRRPSRCDIDDCDCDNGSSTAAAAAAPSITSLSRSRNSSMMLKKPKRSTSDNERIAVLNDARTTKDKDNQFHTRAQLTTRTTTTTYLTAQARNVRQILNSAMVELDESINPAGESLQ